MIGVTSVRNKIEKAQLRWLGQVGRMHKERITKKRWNWRPEGRRSKGRPKKRWKDGVEEILEANGLGTLEEVREEESFERTN